MDYEDKKPSVGAVAQDPSQNQVEQQNPEHINLKVEFPEGEFTNFKIKRVTKMEKLMKAFYAQKGLEPGSVRLLLDDRVRFEVSLRRFLRSTRATVLCSSLDCSSFF